MSIQQLQFSCGEIQNCEDYVQCLIRVKPAESDQKFDLSKSKTTWKLQRI